MTADRTRLPSLLAAAVAAVISAGGCGGTSGKVLENVDNAAPPGSNLRVDVFLIRSVSTCAIGNPCLSPDSQCFFLADDSGPVITFASEGLRFVPPGDPLIPFANQVECFRLTLDDDALARAIDLTTGLRRRIFQDSGGEINLEIRLHQIPFLDAGFDRFALGLFLDPQWLEPDGLPEVNRDTDFVFSITGSRDPDRGLMPRMDHCAGTNRIGRDLLGASTYSWLAMSPGCDGSFSILRNWMIQLYFAQRDVGNLPDLYNRAYPTCGNGDLVPTSWFPGYDDCTRDPDAPSCGQAACPDIQAYWRHILTKHWHRGRPFNGNYCADGRLDFDETSVDSGGVCDVIGQPNAP